MSHAHRHACHRHRRARSRRQRDRISRVHRSLEHRRCRRDAASPPRAPAPARVHTHSASRHATYLLRFDDFIAHDVKSRVVLWRCFGCFTLGHYIFITFKAPHARRGGDACTIHSRKLTTLAALTNLHLPRGGATGGATIPRAFTPVAPRVRSALAATVTFAMTLGERAVGSTTETRTNDFHARQRQGGGGARDGGDDFCIREWSC